MLFFRSVSGCKPVSLIATGSSEDGESGRLPKSLGRSSRASFSFIVEGRVSRLMAELSNAVECDIERREMIELQDGEEIQE